MIGNSTNFNKINSRKLRKPPIHHTTYRGWEYSWLRRWIKRGFYSPFPFRSYSPFSLSIFPSRDSAFPFLAAIIPPHYFVTFRTKI